MVTLSCLASCGAIVKLQHAFISEMDFGRGEKWIEVLRVVSSRPR